MTASMAASACFIGLAVWGWDLPVTAVISFLVICVVFLAAIVLAAAGFGWLLHRLRNPHSDKENDPPDNSR